jgi:hypothetical protein
LLQAAQESKQNFFIFKKWYQNETKTLQTFFKDKTKRLDNLKKFWKRNKTKAFGPEILRTDRNRFVSIQNFDLKTLHSIFFGAKAAKRKLPILKNHWFDIDSQQPGQEGQERRLYRERRVGLCS